MPNLAVIEELKKKLKSVEVLYIGGMDGVEKKMVMAAGITFRGVLCGKLRRYFSFKNFVDGFKIPVGIVQAYRILKKFKPKVVFSKGGFVSVPVCLAAYKLKIPIIIHESDAVPGLANKIIFRFAEKICVSFKDSIKHLKKYEKKAYFTGNPVRKSILLGDIAKGLKFTSLDKFRPVILIMGGSQGARQINELVRANIDELIKKFQIVHIRGRGNLDISLHKPGYVQYEYIEEQLPDLYAISELIVSRGGANSLFEIAILKKKAVVIPLSTEASRGEQVANAQLLASKLGWTILDGAISNEDFLAAINMAYNNKLNVGAKIENGVDKIVNLILQSAK